MRRMSAFVPAVAAFVLAGGGSAAGDAGGEGATGVPSRGAPAGAHVCHPDCARPTPLHLAALRGSAAEIRKLVRAGADVGATDALEETALHSASRRFRAEAAAALVESGAPLEARNRDGMTPLALVASMGPSAVPEVDAAKVRLARLLIEAGANVDAMDGQGATPLGHAEAREHPELVALLRRHGARRGAFAPGELGVRAERAPTGYPTNAQIGAALLAVETDHPTIAKRHELGTLSPSGRKIWAIRISDNLPLEEFEPEVSYVSAMHGDEIVSVELLLLLADWLTDGYGSDPRATAMVDGLDIWLVPTMNPDGYEAGTRWNANGVDLNRDFPDWYDDPVNTPAGRQQETGIIMNWRFDESFTLSANMHGGTLVANYPFDNNPAGTSTYSPSPDDDLFVDISLEYSEDNPPMYASPSFPMGITNGADWYAVSGGMQDWNYFWLGCNEITLELSNVKSPAHSTIPGFWADNQESMISYLERAWDGVRGLVTDASTGDPLAATVTVDGRDHEVHTDPDVGDYHRMLLAGTYALTFEASGYETLVASSVAVSAGASTRLDVPMEPLAPGSLAEVAFPNGGEQLPSGVAQTVTWSGSSTASYQVQATSNYNDVSVFNDGFDSGTLGPGYTTGGDAPWAGTGSPLFAAASGDISDDQVSWLERDVSGPGSVSFLYAVSSEAGWDFFRFFIDGVEIFADSGSTGWIEIIEPLSDGAHTLRWEYAKDSSVSSGSDRAWIDDVKVVTDSTAWTDVVASTGVGATSHPWTPATQTTAAKVRVRKVLPGGLHGAWDESDAVFAVVPPGGCLGDLDGDGDTDVFDFGVFASSFGGSVVPGTSGDYDGNGVVDVLDFGVFAGDFGCVP